MQEINDMYVSDILLQISIYTDMDHTQRQIKGVIMRRRLLGVLGG